MWPYKCPVIPLFGILGLNLMFPCYKSIVISRLYSKLNHLVQAYNASAQCWTVGVSLYSGVVFESHFLEPYHHYSLFLLC